jgi:hypothetical protein
VRLASPPFDQLQQPHGGSSSPTSPRAVRILPLSGITDQDLPSHCCVYIEDGARGPKPEGRCKILGISPSRIPSGRPHRGKPRSEPPRATFYVPFPPLSSQYQQFLVSESSAAPTASGASLLLTYLPLIIDPLSFSIAIPDRSLFLDLLRTEHANQIVPRPDLTSSPEMTYRVCGRYSCGYDPRAVCATWCAAASTARGGAKDPVQTLRRRRSPHMTTVELSSSAYILSFSQLTARYFADAVIWRAFCCCCPSSSAALGQFASIRCLVPHPDACV